MTGTVYLLHFAQPYRHARHYLGWTTDLQARLAEHAAGRGARLLAVVRDAGITWTLARTWPGNRARERALKRQGGSARRCPLCGVQPRACATPTHAVASAPAAAVVRPRPGDELMLARVADAFLDGESLLTVDEIAWRLPVCPSGPRFRWETSVMAALLGRNGVSIRPHSNHPRVVLLSDVRTALTLSA
ncbi:hypothetical protein AB0K48_00610 [Nonomuraea sp. NPDC055795]